MQCSHLSRSCKGVWEEVFGHCKQPQQRNQMHPKKYGCIKCKFGSMSAKMRCCGTKLLLRPFLTKEAAIPLAKQIFGLEVDDTSTVKELESYDDRNFLMKGQILGWPKSGSKFHHQEVDSQTYLFKVMHSRETYRPGFLDAVIGAMQHLRVHLASHGLACPENIQAINGDFSIKMDFYACKKDLEKQDHSLVAKIKSQELQGDGVWSANFDENGNIIVTLKHYVRLLSFIPGSVLLNVELNDELLFQIGQLAAKITAALEDFVHPALQAKQDIWDVKNLLWLEQPKYLEAVADPKKRTLAESGLKLFKKSLLPVILKLPTQTIHSDLNESNILVQMKNTTPVLSGIIDFGDMTHSCRVFEIANCMLYMGLLKPQDFIRRTGVVQGYKSAGSLTKLEYKVLYHCVVARLTLSLLVGNFQNTVIDPENEYLLASAKSGWNVLEMMLGYEKRVRHLYEQWNR